MIRYFRVRPSKSQEKMESVSNIHPQSSQLSPMEREIVDQCLEDAMNGEPVTMKLFTLLCAKLEVPGLAPREAMAHVTSRANVLCDVITNTAIPRTYDEIRSFLRLDRESKDKFLADDENRVKLYNKAGRFLSTLIDRMTTEDLDSFYSGNADIQEIMSRPKKELSHNFDSLKTIGTMIVNGKMDVDFFRYMSMKLSVTEMGELFIDPTKFDLERILSGASGKKITEKRAEKMVKKMTKQTEKDRLKKIHEGNPSGETSSYVESYLNSYVEHIKLGDEPFRSLIRSGHLKLSGGGSFIHLIKLSTVDSLIGFENEEGGKNHPLGTRQHDYFFVICDEGTSYEDRVRSGDRFTLTKKEAKHVALAAMLDGYRPCN